MLGSYAVHLVGLHASIAIMQKKIVDVGDLGQGHQQATLAGHSPKCKFYLSVNELW